MIFGNESADSGGYQVGIRVAHALGRPIVTGLKAIAVEDGALRCEQEVGTARDVYRVPLPAVVTVKEGINLPRYPSVPGRSCAPAASRSTAHEPARARAAARDGAARRARRAAGKQAEVLGEGPARRARRGRAAAADWGSHERPGLRREPTAGRALAAGADLRARATTPRSTRSRSAPPPRGHRRAHAARRRASTAYAPAGLGARDREPRRRRRSSPPGTDRGNEVLAHAAVMTGGVLAANVHRARPATQVTRQRWGGSLLEEARLHGDVKLMTVAPHAVAIEPAGGRAGGRGRSPRSCAARTPSCASSSASTRPTGGLSLAEAPVVVSGGRGVGSAEGFAPLEELAGLLGGVVGCSRAVTSAGWRPHTDQVGQTGTKISPELYIPCGISGATQHMAGCKGAKKLLAINSDPEAPIMASADYAVIGDVLEIVPAITAELRRVRAAHDRERSRARRRHRRRRRPVRPPRAAADPPRADGPAGGHRARRRRARARARRRRSSCSASASCCSG